MTMKAPYTYAYGRWAVTTEGDVEGRSVVHLGTHEGFIDEIAFALGDKCYYSLRFKPVEALNLIKKKATRVNVSLDIDSGTWDMKPVERVEEFKKWLAGRDVTILPGAYYASVELIAGNDPQAIASGEKELKRQTAIDKLTPEERELLGIK